MQQAQSRVSALEEQLRRRDKELEPERNAAADKERRSQEAVAEDSESLIRQVLRLDDELTASR